MAIDAQKQETIESQRELIAQQKAAIDALEHKVSLLLEQVHILRHGLFGRSSERLDPDQLALFAEGEASPAEDAGETPAPPSKKTEKNGHGRAPFNPQLLRETIPLDLEEDERGCPTCGKDLCLIGEDVSERGHFVPAKIIVRRYVKKKYACPDGHTVRTAAAPPALIERCKYEPSVYAHIATAKYCDHLPLHRLAGIFKRHGVHLPKQTMWDMLCRVDELVARPVLAQMRKELLESGVLHADETPVTMRVEDQKGTRTAYAWDWQAPNGRRVVDFTLSRERDGPVRFLGDWGGTLVADAYSGYDKVVRKNGITRAGCWAHARRKLKEALDTGSQSAARVLVHVQRLFRLERAIKLRGEARSLDAGALEALCADVRTRRSRCVVERIFAVAEDLELERSTLPRSALGKALTYLRNQRGPLSVFLDDPRVSIHNNDAERDLRHIAVGRKNWLVFGSPRGGEVACRLYSLVLSCKAVEVDPEAYLEDVLTRIATTPQSEIASLTPWAWTATRVEPTSS